VVTVGRVLLAAPRSFCAGVARLRLAPVGETMFPPRAPFFRTRLGARGAQVAARAKENERGNLPVSPSAPSPARAWRRKS
jgi:hypothetical protein